MIRYMPSNLNRIVLCVSFFVGKRIIVTNGFIKKKDDLPPEEKKRALKYQRDYEERFNAGKYYETQSR